MNINITRISKCLPLLFLTSLSFFAGKAQLLQKKEKYSLQDTLRGSEGVGRSSWNVLHYDITVQPDFQTKTIRGSNHIRFYDEGSTMMQIDMQEPMVIDSVIHKNSPLKFSRVGNVYWTVLRDSSELYNFKKGASSITVYFHGKPREAIRPPWDGGWIWKKDKMGNPWMSVACQGLGASVWYPCKDYQGDEPDSGATLRMIVPDSLMAVGNGRMIEKKKTVNGYSQYSWEVKNPINNYNIIPYIGKYSHFEESYIGEKGPLDLNYWVLDYDVEKAKIQFTDVPKMMKAFEYWFGPYPFYEDGYKLVEAPHLGMEHQSAVAYGNGFKNGYMGRDRSGSGWGLKWDFIIIHESGHEWFANNITTKDIADMWVHEGFTNYSETLFTDYYYGKEAGNDYAVGERVNISNDIPIIGPYGVNKEGSGDMYDKAGNMLHTIRQVIDNDLAFRNILRGLNKRFYHQTVTTAEIEKYMIKESGLDLSKVFDQYLRTTSIPVLEYRTEGKHIWYRWSNCVADFSLPVKYSLNDKSEKWITPSTTWKKMSNPQKASDPNFKINRNFYVLCKKV
jgi:aminopeptidase N